MPKYILMDEFHVTLTAPRGLPAVEYDTIRRTIDDLFFRERLRRFVRAVCRRRPELAQIRVKVSR